MWIMAINTCKLLHMTMENVRTPFTGLYTMCWNHWSSLTGVGTFVD